ncbi:MAG: hypothetical protein QOH00_1058, partial [Gaiellales bacterium]|nr:hypothetical protein [Gaiellales bacterium]
SPQGRKLLAQAQQVARSPQGKKVIAIARDAARDPANRRRAQQLRELIRKRR